MQLTHKGGARATYLQNIRTLHTLRIGPSGRKTQLHEVWSDPDSRLAWVVCNTGTWRLPDKLFAWAEVIEERAAELGFPEPWPCWAVFEERPGGNFEVEIFPDGYHSPAQR